MSQDTSRISTILSIAYPRELAPVRICTEQRKLGPRSTNPLAAIDLVVLSLTSP